MPKASCARCGCHEHHVAGTTLFTLQPARDHAFCRLRRQRQFSDCGIARRQRQGIPSASATGNEGIEIGSEMLAGRADARANMNWREAVVVENRCDYEFTAEKNPPFCTSFVPAAETAVTSAILGFTGRRARTAACGRWC